MGVAYWWNAVLLVMWQLLAGRHSGDRDSAVNELTAAQKQRSKQIDWLSSQVSG